jgi:uncharacterized repeat protein (TIGR03837 family)
MTEENMIEESKMKVFLFCRVIDNFGDIAVSWRLAQQLAKEHGAEVTLVSDQMAVFAQLEARVCAVSPSQTVAGIQILAWMPAWEDDASILLEKGWPQVLIEMFSCRLPVAYESALSQHSPRLAWLAVDYLSAESWVESYHTLPSPQSGGMVKYFFFPGFSAKTGGLFCEAELMAHVLAEKRERDNQPPLTLYGMNRRIANELWISLFAYEPLILGAWVTFLSERNRPVTLFVPRGRVSDYLVATLGLDLPVDGCVTLGSVRLRTLPMLPSAQYDTLLAACDVNFVRGEDSLLRGLWAMKPLIWQIYPQEADHHLVKLDAFLARYTDSLNPSAAQAFMAWHQAWNATQMLPNCTPSSLVETVWPTLEAQWPALLSRAERWPQILLQEGNFANRLVSFAKNALK